MSRNNWNDQEVTAICKAYLYMSECERNGIKFNKAQIRRELITGGLARSHGSIEAKFMNCSAVAQKINGMHVVKGYKPLQNYQAALSPALREVFNGRNLLVMQELTKVDLVPVKRFQAFMSPEVCNQILSNLANNSTGRSVYQ